MSKLTIKLRNQTKIMPCGWKVLQMKMKTTKIFDNNEYTEWRQIESENRHWILRQRDKEFPVNWEL